LGGNAIKTCFVSNILKYKDKAIWAIRRIYVHEFPE
ncbi:MAG: hypothetical protein RJA53_1424, partial [Bacteroidota bacterium]